MILQRRGSAVIQVKQPISDPHPPQKQVSARYAANMQRQSLTPPTDFASLSPLGNFDESLRSTSGEAGLRVRKWWSPAHQDVGKLDICGVCVCVFVCGCAKGEKIVAIYCGEVN